MSSPEKDAPFSLAVIGLGYVGLPLAVAFAEKYRVLGFDTDRRRIEQINGAKDQNGEVDETVLTALLHSNAEDQGLFCTNDPEELANALIYIITVPTPVDNDKRPDLSVLKTATATVARHLKKNDIVIYESTVYPGCTEEECVPVLETVSGLRYNEDFFIGYSPERINPGDKMHTVFNTVKITAGSTPATADKVDELYASVIPAGTFRAASVKVAEAAKAVENAQRDINISFMNELARIFDKMDIDTYDVLAAAGTKWNFLPFRPGLVGGHCIGVDPYYLAYKALQVGVRPQVINSGREVNEGMGQFAADKIERLLVASSNSDTEKRILILGFTFKENCPDIRNTGVKKMIDALTEKGYTTDIYDPWANEEQVFAEYGWHLLPQSVQWEERKNYAVVVLAVAHDVFRSFDFAERKRHGSLIFDIKGILPKELSDGRL